MIIERMNVSVDLVSLLHIRVSPSSYSSNFKWFCLYFSSFAPGKWFNNTKCQATSSSFSTILSWSFTQWRNAKFSVQRNIYFIQIYWVHISD